MPNRTIREARDTRRAIYELATHLPPRLLPLAWIAYNYRWVWSPNGHQVFSDVDPARWELCHHNPVRFLQEVSRESLEDAARNSELVARVEAMADALNAYLSRPFSAETIPAKHPIAFFSAEFGIHGSLPLYSGGLGVLAGDILKEASDRALPLVGIGLLYEHGYFRQRIDGWGWQHEYWIETDPTLRPMVQVKDHQGHPMVIHVPIWGTSVAVQIWRVEIGRIPLILLDAELPENSPLQRFVTDRLYDGNRHIRLAQYALLGIGGVRALHALRITPSVIHLNEGHPAPAAFELAAREVAKGASFADACEMARRKLVFTSHTPVSAGNETYSTAEFQTVFPDLAQRLHTDWNSVLGLGRVVPQDDGEPLGMTVLAMRMSRSTNGVSRRHGEVARSMWRSIFPVRKLDQVPISHVTNGVHLPTWMAPPFQRLFDRYLGPDWSNHPRVTDSTTWQAVEDIPDEELWAAKVEATTQMVERVRSQSIPDRLREGDAMEYVLKASQAFKPNILTLGFARRLASYKRLHLLIRDLERFFLLLERADAIQLLVAGKAHPQDDQAKRLLQEIFALKSHPRFGARVVFLEDYDMRTARMLVAGCHVWVNLPRPPLEASGTSGMKAALNGTINLSVLDGWWIEAYDGSNGWAIDSTPEMDSERRDARDADAFYNLLEQEVIPLFYRRGRGEIPHEWVRRMKHSIRTIAPSFCATRMLDDYMRRIYFPA